jgi:hypothetical protein
MRRSRKPVWAVPSIEGSNPSLSAERLVRAYSVQSNVLGIVGGIVVFGDPLGQDSATVVGRLLAFGLVVSAVALVPAPVRAHEAVRRTASASGA